MPTDKLNSHQDKIPYSMVSREVQQNILNPDSLAIWCYIQSLPPDWDLSEKQLREHFSVGKTRYMAGMRYLREMGLYEIELRQDESGAFSGKTYHFYPYPQVSKTVPTVNHRKYRKPKLPKKVATENSTYIKEKTPIHRTIKDKEKDILVGKPDERVKSAIDYLNLKTGHRFQSGKENTKIITSLLTDYRIEDLMAVVDSKTAEWMNTEHQKYLRPSTLFRRSKFIEYLGMAHIPKSEKPLNGVQILTNSIGENNESRRNGNGDRQFIAGNQRDMGIQVISIAAGKNASAKEKMGEEPNPFYS